MSAPRIHPIILSGGSGTRLWPASRRSAPKQFLRFIGEDTMLQATARRLSPGPGGPDFAPLMVLGAARHEEHLRAQLAALGLAPGALIFEPMARNTAPAAAAAAAFIAEQDPTALVLLAPADHHMPEPDAFRAVIAAAAPAAQDGAVVTFGITPTGPHTGYGYIRAGEASGPVAPVTAFREKPDRATAQTYLDSGDYSWNAGVFLFRADVMGEQMRTHAPEVAAAAEAAVARARRAAPCVYLDADSFAAAPDISIDYAVMERTDRAGVARLDAPWSDLGAWSAVWEQAPQDAAGNAALSTSDSAQQNGHGGETAAFVDARGVLTYSSGPMIGAIGVEDLVIIATPDAVLVSRRDRCEEVKAIVKRLRDGDRDDLL